MIDFHTHILPKVDDGSKSCEESLRMLSELKKQGIKTVVATPHFYANDESVDSFLERRNKAYTGLRQHMDEDIEIALGAEVRYYNGISCLEDLKKLRLESSRLLLLEMPFRKWTGYDINEVVEIASGANITVVLAHVERYLSLQKKEVFHHLLDNGVLFQCNASFFSGYLAKNKALKMVRNNQMHFIGSDCHNMTDRAPEIIKAFLAIEKKYGEEFLSDYVNYGNELFLQNKINKFSID